MFSFWIVQVGRPTFDEFLKKYIATFKFKSIDTETFIDFLKANIPGIETQIDLKLWTEGTGIPLDAHEPDSSVYKLIVTLANEFINGRIPGEDEVADWQGQEWELYLENLPKSTDASQVVLLYSNECPFFHEIWCIVYKNSLHVFISIFLSLPSLLHFGHGCRVKLLKH